ncbi:hypothetical protein CLUG_04324 [Clavispora lusitaniae ATCC 42720]|uniref:Tc1-like transposase DDE domain-containing protein n=1 Tax=Clavispora lusitaniae (strain ATCC 42720) TaxID=306902 RepID=C4Y7Z6_CLAL4|nr:uncharacterized protein CLUG_04324 [Clavispora lusitaniae ATCC 42720]EEQ40196.1 hypothetical protein CLUG_04324 [Clavispora lusitaniae ATCC 42720]
MCLSQSVKNKMEFNSCMLDDAYIDGLGNRFCIDPKLVSLSEGSLDDCFSFRDYKKQNDTGTEECGSPHAKAQEQSMTDVEIMAPTRKLKPKSKEYKKYSKNVKERFWHDIIEEGYSAYSAAKKHGINLQTAYSWKRNWNKQIYLANQGLEEPSKKRGRKPLLNKKHMELMNSLVEDDASVTLDSMLESLRLNFSNLEVSATTMHSFATKVCNLSVKRISKWPARSSSEFIKGLRYQWAKEYGDKLNFSDNCIFIDEAGFNLSTRREYGWSSVGEKAMVNSPIIGGLNISFIGAISSHGCISLKVRHPQGLVDGKKGKLDTDATSSKSNPIGTTAGHFYDFVQSVMEQKNQSEELRNLKYLILDDASIHKRHYIQLLVASSDLELVFLPPYSPCLNAMEEFWAVCKSKVKKAKVEKKEGLNLAVCESVNSISIESYEGFCRHAGKYIEYCLDRQSF